MKMKNLLIVAVALQASFVMANYVNYGANYAWGDLNDASNWEGGVVPSGSTTGVVSDVIVEAWAGSFSDISIRQTGSYVGQASDRFADPITFYDPNPDYETLFNGGSVSGVVGTVYEIDDPRTDYASYTNFNVGKLAFWSANGGETEFSILSGHVETKILRLVAWDKGSINMRDGILHAETNDQSGIQFNMLAGGTGNITIDGVGEDVFGVNFETGSQASFTLGSKLGGAAGGVWEWAIGNGNISIDGVVTSNLVQYVITSTDGTNSTISLRQTDISAYDLFTGVSGDPLNTWGELTEPTHWDSGSVPFGSSTGLILNADIAAGAVYDIAVRMEDGRIHSWGGEFQMRGGTNGAPYGASVIEIDDPNYASTTNLDVGSLTLWSQFGEGIELSILQGTVESAGALNLVTGGQGTINMRDGLLHAGSWSGGDATFNMLAGGTGEIVIDDMNYVGVGATYLNFESGNQGSFTFLDNGTNTVGGNWEWAVANSNVSINGVVEADLSSFDITSTDGTNSTITLSSGFHLPTTVSWTDAGADNKWATAANWDVGVPLSGDDVVIDDGGAGALKEAGNDASIVNLDVGLDNTGALTINGAVRPVDTVRIGENTGATGAVTVVSGDGTFNGWTSLTGFILKLAENGGHASLTNNGGTIKVYSEWFNVDAWGNGGTAHVQLNGGYIVAEGFHMVTGGGGSVDFAGGSMAIKGDLTYALPWEVDLVAEWITSGQFTAYGVTNDASRFVYDYDITNPGYTTISAVPTAMALYLEWAEGHPGMGALTDDDENGGLGDGMDNLFEYAVGGDPLFDDAAALMPTTFFPDGDTWLYIYRRRNDAAARGLTYDLQFKSDLIYDLTWTSTGGAGETGTNTTDLAFDVVTNTIPTVMDLSGEPYNLSEWVWDETLFLNLEITENF